MTSENAFFFVYRLEHALDVVGEGFDDSAGDGAVAMAGEVRWTHEKVSPNTRLYGTDDVIYVVPTNRSQAVALRASDGKPLPIAGVAGDQQAALVGQACFKPGMGKSTYGTGCFMIVNTGETASVSRNRLLTTIGYRINGKPTYAMEGSIFVAGATVQWLRDGLNLFADASETEALAQKTRSGHSVYLVPAFTGLGAPHWDPKARGAIFGLTRDTGIAEIVAAGLQAVCYQTRDLQHCMNDDMEAAPGNLRVDGGMVKNSWVMQFLADMLNVQVDRPTILETTALGAAYLAGLRLGWYDTLEEIEQLWRCERSFTPTMEEETREKLYQGWLDAVSRVRST